MLVARITENAHIIGECGKRGTHSLRWEEGETATQNHKIGMSNNAFFTITIVAEAIFTIFDSMKIVDFD